VCVCVCVCILYLKRDVSFWSVLRG